MKVAIAHDSITQLGGAERVLEALHELYPDAPVFTLIYDKNLPEEVREKFEGWTIVSSPLQFLYNFLPRLQLMLPFIPIALRFFDFKGFDLVISSSSVFAKNIRVPKNTVHINYCHTPARFLWLESESYVKEEVPAIIRPIIKLYLKWMRRWDYAGAQRVDYFIANSKNVQAKIKKLYNRDSAVIYPCIDLDKFYPSAPKENYFLSASRLQPHKRADIVVEAFNKLGWPLHVVGTGRDEARLRAIAKENIVFLGRVDDRILCNEYSAAKALVFPQDEDLGLTVPEANAAGTPVIAFRRGGALETVIENKTGIFFDQQNADSLTEALRKFEMMRFQTEDLFTQAEKFSKEHFKSQITEFINSNANANRN